MIDTCERNLKLVLKVVGRVNMLIKMKKRIKCCTKNVVKIR